MNENAEVTIDRMATGGEGVGRLDDGRVVFVRGAVPGDRVQVEITELKKRFARGQTLDVIEAGPSRTPVVCDHGRSGECGGCDWLHVTPNHQREFKTTIVQEQLVRLGGIESPVVEHHPDPAGRRTTVRCAVEGGRAGYRRRRSSDRFAADSCQAVHPDLEALMLAGRFDGVDEVTLRVGVGTGDRLAVLHPAYSPQVELPPDVVIAAADTPGAASFTTEVAGRPWRVSATAFFQSSDRGAETLVDAVRSGLAGSDGPVVDLYSGGGLLGGGAAPDRLDTAVESSAAAVADAEHNLPDVRVVESRVERWRPDRPWGAVIADPARSGLGPDGLRTVEATQAPHLVLVSCDPAALGRDAGLLRESGWAHQSSTVIDMFADTSRIEVVSVFRR